jgi:hypothetical protein
VARQTIFHHHFPPFFQTVKAKKKIDSRPLSWNNNALIATPNRSESLNNATTSVSPLGVILTVEKRRQRYQLGCRACSQRRTGFGPAAAAGKVHGRIALLCGWPGVLRGEFPRESCPLLCGVRADHITGRAGANREDADSSPADFRDLSVTGGGRRLAAGLRMVWKTTHYSEENTSER